MNVGIITGVLPWKSNGGAGVKDNSVTGAALKARSQPQASQPPDPQRHFSAFISYSHQDARSVRKLHRQLEGYRLPKHLGAITALNQNGGALGPIFRDRDDLSASHSLSSAITQALDAAHVLIVACSPSAKDSHWVGQEIIYFKTHHPGRPILAAILAGEPERALPVALSEGASEPLAADLRAARDGGDGWRLGFLKVVAGIAGVPLDTLVQRDSQRQMRRVMAVTGVVAIVALAMGVMTTIAIQARNEAQFQRDEAEGLVGYMMEDLRRELQGVGRLDVMDGVNARALEYYAGQGNPKDLTPRSLEQRAAILHAQGEDLERAGKLVEALEKFTEAHRDTGELLAREPGNSDRIFAHAQSEFWVGFAAWRQAEPDVARPHWQNYATLSERLLSYDRTNVNWIMEVGYAKSNLGTLALRGDGDTDLATQLFGEAIEFFREASLLSPDNLDIDAEIADAHGWRADAYRAAGDPGSALEQRRAQRALLERLIESDPKDAFFQNELVGNFVGAAQAYLDISDRGEAMEELRKADAQVRRLMPASPNNEDLRLQERAIRLMMVRADDGQSASSKAALRSCATDLVIQGEPELSAFCSYLRVNFGLQSKGQQEEFASPFPNMRLTPRWGLEL